MFLSLDIELSSEIEKTPNQRNRTVIFKKSRGNPLENFSTISVRRQTYAPSHPLSNSEHSHLIAISVAELFNKQPTAFYFEMDNS
jgi:hypothetical protein